VDPPSLHKTISFAECLICGGRGFFGLTCQKCNDGVYNIGIGFCAECNSSGTLGTKCQTCRLSRYQSSPIRCVNTSYGTIFKCIMKPELDQVWYNDVQKSFLESVREQNLKNRYSGEVDMRVTFNAKKAQYPEDYLPESSAVRDLKDGFECILENLKGNDLGDEDVKIDCKWENEHKKEPDYETDSEDELLKDIPDSTSEVSLSDFPDIPLEEINRQDKISYLIFACCPLMKDLTP